MNEFAGSLGLRSISSCLKQSGHTVQMIFLIPRERFDHDLLFPTTILQELSKLVENSDIIGISSMASDFRNCTQVINHLKALNKPIVWGGIHATSCPDECIKYADAVCIGEGEEAFCELVETMEKQIYYFDIKNFWFTKNGRIIKNPVRPLIQNLDSLPPLDYEPDSHYILEKGSIIKAISEYKALTKIYLHTIRGCTNECSYCCNSLLRKLYYSKDKKIRKLSIEATIKELARYKDKFPRLDFIWFTDDTIFIRTLQELKLFAKEYKEKINLPFQCFVSPDTIDDEKLKLLINAGLYKLEMGIQTGSESLNKNLYNRNISNMTVMKGVQIINKYKTKMEYPNYQLLYCNPYETDKNLIETITLLQKLPPPYCLQAFPLQFFPGLELYKKAECDGLLKEKIFVNFGNYKKALELNTREIYLNFLIYLMTGTVTVKNLGRLPRFLLPILTNKKVINYFKKHDRELASLIKSGLNSQITPFSPKIKKYILLGKFLLNCISSDICGG
jgi:radical SAM superfamily enzyme YgiQ (UPF0313 family)